MLCDDFSSSVPVTNESQKKNPNKPHQKKTTVEEAKQSNLTNQKLKLFPYNTRNLTLHQVLKEGVSPEALFRPRTS